MKQFVICRTIKVDDEKNWFVNERYLESVTDHKLSTMYVLVGMQYKMDEVLSVQPWVFISFVFKKFIFT